MVGLWFKDAVIYCLDVDSDQDFDGDGAGDFHGLMDRLDHIAGLGATCIWVRERCKLRVFDVMNCLGGTRIGRIGTGFEGGLFDGCPGAAR